MFAVTVVFDRETGAFDLSTLATRADHYVHYGDVLVGITQISVLKFRIFTVGLFDIAILHRAQKRQNSIVEFLI